MSYEEGRLLKQARKEKKIRQLDLAEKVGISHAPIHKFENGEENISLSTLRKIFNEVGLEVVIQRKDG